MIKTMMVITMRMRMMLTLMELPLKKGTAMKKMIAMRVGVAMVRFWWDRSLQTAESEMVAVYSQKQRAQRSHFSHARR
jgi:hypothetical protein